MDLASMGYFELLKLGNTINWEIFKRTWWLSAILVTIYVVYRLKRK